MSFSRKELEKNRSPRATARVAETLQERSNDLALSLALSLAKREPTIQIKTLFTRLRPHKKHPEIKDAGEQVSALEQRARSAVGASAELERELRVSANDALRLQASLPGLEDEALEAEGQLEAFR